MQAGLVALPGLPGGIACHVDAPEPELKRRRIEEVPHEVTFTIEQADKRNSNLPASADLIHLLVQHVKAPTPRSLPTSSTSVGSFDDHIGSIAPPPPTDPLVFFHQNNPEPCTPRATSLGTSIFTPTRQALLRTTTRSATSAQLDLPLQPPSIRTQLPPQPTSARATPSHPSSFAPSSLPVPVKMQSGPGSPYQNLLLKQQRESALLLLMQQGLPFMPSSSSSPYVIKPSVSSGAATSTPASSFVNINGASPLAAVSQTSKRPFPPGLSIFPAEKASKRAAAADRESSPSSPLSRPLSPGSWLLSKGKLCHFDLVPPSSLAQPGKHKANEDEQEAARDLLLLSHSPPPLEPDHC